jgi:hypothetical protein
MVVLYELAVPGEGVLDIHDQLGERDKTSFRASRELRFGHTSEGVRSPCPCG